MHRKQTAQTLWEANADLHRDGGSHNHQCFTTKAAVVESRKPADPPPPSLSPPSLLPLSATQKRAVSDHTVLRPGENTGKPRRVSHLQTCHHVNAIKLLFLCSLCEDVSSPFAQPSSRPDHICLPPARWALLIFRRGHLAKSNLHLLAPSAGLENWRGEIMTLSSHLVN